MATLDDLKRSFRALMDGKENTQEYQLAKTGDGTDADTADVPSEAGWVWCRLAADQNKPIKVFSLVRGLPQEVPVIVGRPYPDAEYLQIIITVHPVYQRKLTDDQIDQYTTQRHGEAHGETGYDRAPIGLRNLEPARLRETSPQSLSVYVEYFRYSYGAYLVTWSGGTIDLTASVPGAAGHRYVLVYLDPVTNTLGSTDGDIVPLAMSPTLPAVTVGTIPLAMVDLEQGETTIGETDIFDYRQLWNITGGVGDHTHSGSGDGGASLLCVQELFVANLPVVLTGNSLTPWGFFQTLYVGGLYGSGDQELVTIHPDPAYAGLCPQMILIRPGPFGLYDTYEIDVRHGVGNIWLTGEEDITLDKQTDMLLLVYNGEYWCDVGWQAEDRWTAQLIAEDVTKTVKPDGTGDFVRIQDAVDWFKGKTILGSCVIEAEPGTYNEIIAFDDIFIEGGGLTLQGDARVLAGISYVDGAAMNQKGLTNGGSGACSLSNAGNVITVTGATTNPDFDADGWGSGDKVLVYDNTGTITEYTVSSTLNNTITLSVAAPNVGNDATAICLLPNRRIEIAANTACTDIPANGVTLDGWFLRSQGASSAHGVTCAGGSATLNNIAIYADHVGIYTTLTTSNIFANGGAVSVWGSSTWGVHAVPGYVNIEYSVMLACVSGSRAQLGGIVLFSFSVGANCSTRAFHALDLGYMGCSFATARQNGTAYFAENRGYLVAVVTNANNNGNAVNYNPAVSDVFGNRNGSITWS